MEASPPDRRGAFEFWLRTGRWPRVRTDEGTEVKFNPWYDPVDGRFTFSGSGRFVPRRSSGAFKPGGGSYGGGGKTGSWEASSPKRAPVVPNPTSRGSSAATTRRTVDRAIGEGAEPPWRTEVRNGYTFKIDGRNRTRSASGDLRLASMIRRSRAAQARAGGADRRKNDEGGHYIAARFDGPTEAFNHFAQDREFNRSDYRRLEDQWAANKRAGRHVRVRIVPHFEKSSARPDVINVYFWLDGMPQSRRYPNGQERSHGRK